MKNILIYGDSNSWGYDYTRYVPEADTFQRMTEDEHWPGLVRKILGPDYNIIVNALNGRTVVWDDPYTPDRSGLKGLRPALDMNAPLDLVILKLGCNELKEFFNLSAAMIAYGMEKLVKECKVSYYGYPAPKVLLIAPAQTHPDIGSLRAASRFGPHAYSKSLELGRYYRQVAERNGCGFIDCGEMGFEINAVDGLHYSKADHAKLAPVVAAKIKEMLEG
ncbi:MAG: hydrolase [Firmicutes bacterium]|nr:hydrolase [Bacillota bacterium]